MTPDEANRIRAQRLRDGFGISETGQTEPADAPVEKGCFYLLLLFPELSQTRIKVGYASSLDARLMSHRTTCPTLKLVKSWTCKATWESAAIACVTQVSTMIGVEVFDCADLDSLTARLDSFFELVAN